RRYDVIHFHNVSLLGPAVLRLDSNGGAVKMYTTHEHWLGCPIHILWKETQQACDKPPCFRCGLNSKRPIQMLRYTGMLRRAAQSVDLFVSPSRFTAHMHAQRGFSRPVHHLPYFLDAERESKGASLPPHPGPYFLFVGRLELIKGLQTVIPLWQHITDYDL